LPDENAVANVARYHRRALADHIHAQMQDHRWQRSSGYEVVVSNGFTLPRSNSYTAAMGEEVRDYRKPVAQRLLIKGMRFGGFSKCLYPEQKFDSDTERLFAVLCERDRSVLKWFKPARGEVHIVYQNSQLYVPDFVVEAKTAKFLVEPKRSTEMNDPDVLAKAEAAVVWCVHATNHERKVSGKPWSYLLIPHDAINAQMSLAGLAATYTREAK
jgi:type III restriction enzyme